MTIRTHIDHLPSVVLATFLYVFGLILHRSKNIYRYYLMSLFLHFDH